RGQLLLARTKFTHRHYDRQESNKGLGAQADDSATAVPLASTGGGYDHSANNARADSGAHLTMNNQTKGASGFQVSSAQNASNPSMAGRRISQSSGPAVNARKTKLVRVPRNTQSLDANRSQEFRPRPSLFSRLFACCSPVSLFSRSPSYGSMRNDANRQNRGSAETDAAQSQCDDSERRVKQEQRAQGQQSLAESTIEDESANEDEQLSHQRLEQQQPLPTVKVTPDPAEDNAREGDRLIPAAEEDAAPADEDSYTSPGSGLRGALNGTTSPVAAVRSATVPQASAIPSSAAASAQTSDYGTHSSAYSDLGTDAGVSSVGNSVYRTPPTSFGGSSYLQGELNR
ncbi:hypothetical protein EC988_005826, partial [Linderina pennispora]